MHIFTSELVSLSSNTDCLGIIEKERPQTAVKRQIRFIKQRQITFWHLYFVQHIFKSVALLIRKTYRLSLPSLKYKYGSKGYR
jgi:hypothetical protein